MSTKPIVSQRLFVNPINKVMSMEQIFQDISKDSTRFLKVYVAKIEARKT